MNEKIIDPRLYDVDFEKRKIPLFIVPSKNNRGTAKLIRKKLKNKFSIEAEINDLMNNLYFSIRKNEIPSLISFVKDSNLIKSLEINDMSQEGINL